MTISGKILWVWEDGRPAAWPVGYDSALVKAFDGRSLVSRQGVNWMANYHNWKDSAPGRPTGAWGAVYPDDGESVGQQMAPHLNGAAYIVLDVEDWNGAHWSDDQIRAVVAGFRTHLAGIPLGYSSYPTRKQCQEHGINQALLDELCDFAFPQVYFPYQAAELPQVFADHKHPIVTVSPADDGAWHATAVAAETRTQRVAFWRMGVADWQGWGVAVADITPPVKPPVPVPDPLRPVVDGPWPAGRFVAWDGRYWSLTDGLWWRDLTQAMADGLHKDGVPVLRWVHCRSEAVQVH